MSVRTAVLTQQENDKTGQNGVRQNGRALQPHETAPVVFPVAFHLSSLPEGGEKPSAGGHDFSRVPVQTGAAVQVQAKLMVNTPGDRYEQEAERTAEAVVRGPKPQKPGFPAINKSPKNFLHYNPVHGEPRTTPPSLKQALRSPGRPLDPAVRSFMEPRFGRDFNQVRIHTGGQAAVSADHLNARAYTIGQNIVFGRSQYAFGAREGRRLLAHELTHTIQQGPAGADLVVQRDLIDDVRDKLSYGLFDWAITDSEAMEAMALLGSIPAANLAAELNRLGTKYVTRLLDNLPDAAKTGPIYQRIVEALGSAGVTPYAEEQLSYGLFDWAITDEEVTRVFNTFTNLPAAAQEQFLADLNNSGRLGRLISNSNNGHHALYIRPWISTLTRGGLTPRQRAIVKAIVKESSNSAIETLKLATETRFDVAVGKTTIPDRPPVEWEPGPLREAYLALDDLPDAHVSKNKELLRLGQFKLAAEGGVIKKGTYSRTRRELALNVSASGFRETIIHEVAHAVDKEMGWRDGPEPAKPERGGWKSYGANYDDCAREMVADSGGAITTLLTAVQRQDVIDEMADAMSNRTFSGLKKAIRDLPWFGGLPAATKRSVLDDKALKAIRIGLNQPWFNARDGGEHLGDHVYQESYPDTWVRYRHEARSRMVSDYQFRAPGEWFAEAYEFYYRPDDRGRGAKLADKDPDTKRYFDLHVHTRAPSR